MAKALKSRPAETSAGYDEDYYLWLVRQVDLLRAHRLDAIDVAMIAEELDDMGKSERRALVSAYRVLLMHLLKWEYQPEKRTRSWRTTILTQRDAIEEHEADSPSLARRAAEIVAAAYPKAVAYAVEETDLPASTFPPTCPWSLDQLHDTRFLPGLPSAASMDD